MKRIGLLVLLVAGCGSDQPAADPVLSQEEREALEGLMEARKLAKQYEADVKAATVVDQRIKALGEVESEKEPRNEEFFEAFDAFWEGFDRICRTEGRDRGAAWMATTGADIHTAEDLIKWHAESQ